MSDSAARPFPRLALLLASLCSLTGAASAQDGADETVSLPPFFVEPPSRPERWIHATGPGFELLTTNDADFARGYARQYYRQLDLVRQLVPDRYQWEPYLPTQHLVVGTDSRRQETDAAMQEALERFKQQSRAPTGTKAGQTRFLPNLRISGHDSSTVFAFQDAPERDLRNDNFTLRFIDGNLGRKVRDTPAFYFTAARLEEKLSRRTPALPPWFIAGLTGVYRNVFFSDQDVQVATLVWQSPDLSASFRRDPDHPRELLVLSALFAAPPPDAPAQRRLWEHQAELFVRWALFADDHAHRGALWDFVDKLELGPPSERNFRAAFGFGLAEARDRLSDYLNAAVSETFEIKGTPDLVIPEITTRRATADIVGRIKGEWERIETGYVRQHAPALTELYLNRARATVDRARQAGDTPQLQGIAGLIEFEAGNFASARTELEAAVAAGEGRPRVLQALARLRYDELRARHPADQLIPAEEIGAVTVLLDAAVATTPPVPEVYLQLAELWLNTDAPMATEDLAALAAGARFYPQQPALVARLALLQAQRGQPASALQIVAYARSRCRDPRTAQFYDRLHDELSNALAQR